MPNIKLGYKYKDKISGFTGIAVSSTKFINGCDRISLQAKVDKDGSLPKEKWFDDIQLVQVGKIAALEIKTKNKTGGPRGSSPEHGQRSSRA